MKRDMDLARRILFEVEAAPSRSKDGIEELANAADYSPYDITQHVGLLIEAGLVEGEVELAVRWHSA